MGADRFAGKQDALSVLGCRKSAVKKNIFFLCAMQHDAQSNTVWFYLT